MSDDEGERESIPEDNAQFTGESSCDHHADEHGWMGCDHDCCACEAHWEE